MTIERQELGKSGKMLAAEELERRRYAILDRRYRTGVGATVNAKWTGTIESAVNHQASRFTELPLEPPDREDRGECRGDLERHDLQRGLAFEWQPLDREEADDRQLSGYEDLPDVSGGPLVFLLGGAVECDMRNQDG